MDGSLGGMTYRLQRVVLVLYSLQCDWSGFRQSHACLGRIEDPLFEKRLIQRKKE